jgi:hypothetical protein
LDSTGNLGVDCKTNKKLRSENIPVTQIMSEKDHIVNSTRKKYGQISPNPKPFENFAQTYKSPKQNECSSPSKNTDNKPNYQKSLFNTRNTFERDIETVRSPNGHDRTK